MKQKLNLNTMEAKPSCATGLWTGTGRWACEGPAPPAASHSRRASHARRRLPEKHCCRTDARLPVEFSRRLA